MSNIIQFAPASRARVRARTLNRCYSVVPALYTLCGIRFGEKMVTTTADPSAVTCRRCKRRLVDFFNATRIAEVGA